MATSLEDLRVLQDCEQVADSVWKVVLAWDDFAKETIGKQLVRAVDSIGANVAESYGRFHFGEKQQFLSYGRGSLFETKYWLNRCYGRQLISADQLKNYAKQLNSIGRQINNFVKSLKTQQSSNKIREPETVYQINNPQVELFSKTDLGWLASIQIPDDQSPISRPQVVNLPKD
jgi:four helix bundle protein